MAWALAKVRPQHELPVPDDTWCPDVRVAYVYGEQEPAVAPEWIKLACRERLGIEAPGMAGGHSLFVSRPAPGPSGTSWVSAASTFMPSPITIPSSASQSTESETLGSGIGLVAPVSEPGNLENSAGYSGRLLLVYSTWPR